MIELKGLKKIFHRSRPTEVVALAGIDLTIPAGQFVVLVGENGSGKSTLLNAIAGSLLLDEGKIAVGDHDLTKVPEHRRSRFISRVFQNPLAGTAPSLSVLDNFRLAALRTRPKGLRFGTRRPFVEKVRKEIARLNLGLENKLDQPMGTLSGGQRQALTLLMSVFDDLQVLLLDEPTAALDPNSARMVMSIADQLIAERSLTAILVTHNLNEALRYGDRLIQMRAGTIARDVRSTEKSKLEPAEVLNWFNLYS